MNIIKPIRLVTVLLFVLLLASCFILPKGLVKSPEKALNVQEVFNKLARVSGTGHMEPLLISSSDEINAWTDGQNITITKGLLRVLKNEDELAVILGHEMGHVLAGDTSRNGQTIDPRYLEANADKIGAYLMLRAGFDVCRGKEVMRTFQELFGDDAASTTHPDHAFRLDQLNLPQCPK